MSAGTAYKGLKRIDFTPAKVNYPLPANYQLIRSWRWTRQGGPASQIEYSGNFVECYNKARIVQPDYDSLDIDQISGQMFRLRAAQVGDEVTEVFDVNGSSLSQSILINPNVKARFIAETAGTAQPITDDDGIIGDPSLGGFGYSQVVSEIRAAVNKHLQSNDYDQMVADVQQATGSVPAPQVAMELMTRLSKGVNYFLNTQYTFTHTINIAERLFLAGSGSFVGAYDNTNCIFTEAQLRLNYAAGGESIPPEFILPANKEWLKLYSSIQLTTGQNRSIVSHYQSADEIDRLEYALASL